MQCKYYSNDMSRQDNDVCRLKANLNEKDRMEMNFQHSSKGYIGLYDKNTVLCPFVEINSWKDCAFFKEILLNNV